ncbi:hypothetical protein [Streptomyces achromogenes]|uniref:hypothetical protein n=1 Tax=Streptomyces achromogenes TaxID=67255 RepID=UPI0036A3701B
METLTWAALGAALIGSALLAVGYVRSVNRLLLAATGLWLVASVLYVIWDVNTESWGTLAIDALLALFWAVRTVLYARRVRAAG